MSDIQPEISQPSSNARRKWRWRRWVLIGFAVLCLLAIPAYYLLHPQLATLAKDSLTKQLEESTGGKVEIGSVQVLPGRIIAKNIKLYEAVDADEAEETGKLFADIEKLEISMPIYEMLSPSPSINRLKIKNGTFHLSFDEQGQSLNRFRPKATQSANLPARRIEFHVCTLNLHQTGRESAEFKRLTIKLHQQQDDLIDFIGHSRLLTSRWTFEGHLNPISEGFDISMHSDAATISAKRLWGLPFLYPMDESFVDFDGTSEVDLRFRFSNTDPFRYRVALKPDKMDVAIPIGGVELSKLRGGLLIEDGLITANQVDAEWVGGAATINGTFDYTKYPLVADLKLTCQDSTLTEFPDFWALPDFVEGRLTAEGTLGIEVDEISTKLFANATGVAAPLSVQGLVADKSNVSIQLEELNIESLPNGEQTIVAQEGELVLDSIFQDRPIRELASQFANLLGTDSSDLVEIDGRASVVSKLILPFPSIDDWNSYKGTVAASSDGLQIGDIILTDVKTSGRLEKGGRLQIDKILAMSNGGTFDGIATVDGQADKLVSAKFLVKYCDTKQLAQTLNWQNGQVEGELFGDIEAWFDNEQSWRVFGTTGSERLSINELAIDDVRSELIVDPSGLRLVDLSGNGGDFSLTIAEANLPFTGENRNELTAEFALSNIDLMKRLRDAHLDDERLRISEPLTLSGRVKGDLANPAELVVKGNGSLPVAEWDDLIVRDVAFEWQLIDQEMVIEKANVAALDGMLEVTTAIPLTDLTAIDEARIGFKNVNLEKLFRLVNQKSALDGEVSGELTIAGLSSDQLTTEVNLNNASVSAAGIRLNEIQGTVSIRDGLLDIETEGKLLDGRFDFTGKTPLDEFRKGRLRGQLNVQQVELRRLAAESPRFAGLKALAGKANVSFAFETNDRQPIATNNSTAFAEGNGKLELLQVRWNESELIKQVSSRISLDQGLLRLSGIDANLSQGQANGSVVFDLIGRKAGRFELNLSRVDLEKWMNAFPKLSEVDPGDADLRLVGTIGRTIAGRGRLNTNRINVYGIRGDSLRSDFQFRFEPKSGSGKIRASRVSMRVAEGRVTSDFVFGFGPTQQISLNAKLDRINAGQLVRSTQLASNLRQGQLSGQIKLEGRNLRSLRDLQGSFRGKLSQTQALRLPVLEDVARFASAGQIASLPYDSEKIELTLSQGTVEIKTLNLNGDLAQLTVDGSIRQGQRLDLNVTVHAGRSETDQQLARLLNIGVTIGTGGLPLGLLADVNALLSERLVFLKVRGTLKRPQISLQAERQLGQEVALFFLNNSFAPNFRLGNLR